MPTNDVRELAEAVVQAILRQQKLFNPSMDTDKLSKSIDENTKAANILKEQEIRSQKAVESYNKGLKSVFLSHGRRLSKFSDDLSSYAKISGDMFEQALSDLNYDYLDRVPEILAKQMSKTTGKDIKTLRGEFKGLSDVIAAQQRLLSLKKMAEYRKVYDQNAEAVIEFKNDIESMGFSIDQLTDENFPELEKELKSLSEAFASTSREIQSGSDLLSRGGKLFSGLAAFGGASLKLATDMKDNLAPVARFGVSVEGVAKDWFQLGMTVEELSSLQADYRQTIISSGYSFEDFNQRLKDSSSTLLEYTGNLADGARIQAEALSQGKLLGANQDEFANMLQRQFKTLNRVFSVTAEQFIEANKQLEQNQNVRIQLFKLDKQRRAAYFEELQLVREQLMMDGLTLEQSQKMLEVISEIGGQSPKDRIKEAAKMQAVLGAIGMGGVGNEAASLMRGGLRSKEDQARFAKIMRQANIELSNRMSKGLGQELMMSQMIATTGMEKYLGPSSTFADFAIQQEKAITTQEKQNLEQQRFFGEMTDTATTTMKYTEQINTVLTNGLIATGIATSAAALSNIQNMLAAGGGMALLGKGVGGKGLKGIAGKFKGGPGLLTAGIMGGNLLYRGTAGGEGVTGGEIGGVTGTLVGGLAGIFLGPVGAMIGSTIGGMAGEKIGEVVADWFGTSEEEKQQEIERMTKAMTENDYQYAKEMKRLIDEGIKTRESFDKRTQDLIDKLDELQSETKKVGDKTSSAVEKQTAEQKEMAKEQERHTDRGYRLMWIRSSG